MYAIVDIETTGGHASANGITELAIILHDGERVQSRFHTLVNPGIRIPAYITALTGISDEMVADAPYFEQVAEKIHDLLSDRVFVAHNVNFDYSFIRHHLAASGFELMARKVCTVRLSRKIFKGLPSYSLGNLCRSLGIELSGRHRAMGDADATVRLFEMLLANDTEGLLREMVRPGNREAYLPLNLPVEQIDMLPLAAGIYYFHDSKDKVIYVGKAVNIRKRVVSHFSNNTPSRRKQEFMRKIHRISFRECGSELVASLMESIEIKRLWPAYNYSQKRWEFSFGIYAYEDQRGIIRLGLEHKRKYLHPIVTVPTLTEGHSLLRKLIRQFELCPRHCFLQRDSDTCVGVKENYCKGICEHREDVYAYNQRVLEAINHLKTSLPSFALLERGRHEMEQTIVLMEKGQFVGMGFVEKGVEIGSRDALKKIITAYPGNELIRALVLREAERHPAKILHLE
jgi:DNA polymerase-3 subunit epsilon